MLRAGYTTYVKLFGDSEEWTKIHWFRVPRTNACLPVASFLQDADWYNLNGPGTILFKGRPPFVQGEQWALRPFDKRLPLPGEAYTGHYCGTERQWAGHLLLSNPADLGKYGCCIPGRAVYLATSCECMSGRFTATVGNAAEGCECEFGLAASSISFAYDSEGCECEEGTADASISPTYSEVGCECEEGTAGSTISLAYDVSGCECGVGLAYLTADVLYDASGCECETGLAYLTADVLYDASGCECETGLAVRQPPSVFDLLGCECGTGLLTAAHDSLYDALGCECSTGLFTGSGSLPLTSFHCATIAAAGSTQATATPITDDTVDVTGGDGTKGVILPSGCYRIAVRSSGGGTVKVYPPVGESISGLSVNSPTSVSGASTLIFCRFPSGKWLSNFIS